MTTAPTGTTKPCLTIKPFFHWLVSKYTRTRKSMKSFCMMRIAIALKYWRGCKPINTQWRHGFDFCVKTAAHNRVVSNKRQKRKGWTCELSENIPALIIDHETAIDIKEAESLIASNRQGQAFKMYVLDDLKLKTIAETMGVSNQRVAPTI